MKYMLKADARYATTATPQYWEGFKRWSMVRENALHTSMESCRVCLDGDDLDKDRWAFTVIPVLEQGRLV